MSILKFSHFPLIKEIAAQLEKNSLRLATAESCTGGALAAAFVSVPGSSSLFDRGFVAYNNDAKEQMLGVPKTLLSQYGAVSEQTARAMAEGAVHNSQASVSVSTTGVAGPERDEFNNPVGTVWVGVYINQTVFAKRFYFEGSRSSINQQAVNSALHYLLSSLLAKGCS